MNARSLLWRQVGRNFGVGSSWKYRRSVTSKANTIEAAYKEILNETREAEEITNSFPSHSPVETVDAEPNYELRNAQIVADYFSIEHQNKLNAGVGAEVTSNYKPHTLLTRPPAVKDVTLELLLASQSHMGHSTSVWHPANARYIYGIREGTHIISLDATAAHLRRAAKIVSGTTEHAGIVLFVGTRKGQGRCVVRAAELAEGCHVFDRWLSGAITNAQQILAGKARVKVVDQFDEDMLGFESQLEDRAILKPDLVVCLNPKENYVLLHECRLTGIPTIGIIDTNVDPSWVTYPIPANDDSFRCVQVIAGVLGRAGQEGQQRRKEAAKRGHITYPPPLNLKDPALPTSSEGAK